MGFSYFLGNFAHRNRYEILSEIYIPLFDIILNKTKNLCSASLVN
jgi:hypothetical protein